MYERFKASLISPNIPLTSMSGRLRLLIASARLAEDKLTPKERLQRFEKLVTKAI